MKTLVTYFSATNTTALAGQKIAKALNADVYEITPLNPYTSLDLDWRNKSSRSSKEMTDDSSRPALKYPCQSINDYQIIFIGYPIWWNLAPRIINTFIEQNDLKDKTIILYATSGGSTIYKSVEVIKNTYPNLKVIPGKVINGNVNEWIKSLNLGV